MKTTEYLPPQQSPGGQAGKPVREGELPAPEHPEDATCAQRSVLIAMVIFCMVLSWLIFAKTSGLWPFAN